MSAEEGYLSNPGRRKLNHHAGGVHNSRDLRQPPHRYSEEEAPAPTHQISYLSMLASQRQTSGGNEEDGITAATAEAMKSFSFERIARSSETNETQQRGSTPHAPFNPELPRNGPAPFLASRHSRQFIPQKTSKEYDSVQEKHSRAVTKPEKPHHEAPLHNTPHEAQRDTSSRGIRPDGFCDSEQPSSSLQEVPFQVNPHFSPLSMPNPRRFFFPTRSSNHAANRTEIPNEHLEHLSDEDEQAGNDDHEVQGQGGDPSNDSANEAPAGYFRSSDIGDEQQEVEQPPSPEQYMGQSHDHSQPIETIPSQDSSAITPRTSGFSAGFAAQFEDYVRAHQQVAQDAEERWKNATIEEWKAGKYEMIEHVRKIVDLTKNHMKRKLTAYRALHDDLDGHRDVLQKRRKLLGKLENDAQQTGKGLMNRLTGK